MYLSLPQHWLRSWRTSYACTFWPQTAVGWESTWLWHFMRKDDASFPQEKGTPIFLSTLEWLVTGDIMSKHRLPGLLSVHMKTEPRHAPRIPPMLPAKLRSCYLIQRKSLPTWSRLVVRGGIKRPQGIPTLHSINPAWTALSWTFREHMIPPQHRASTHQPRKQAQP